jgi:hypothetical protein
VETCIKIKDLGSFNIPILISCVFHGEALCDLGANINLMSIETFTKIKGLRMTPYEKLVGVADGTMTEPEEVLFNVQVEVENFNFLVDIVVMDMAECPVTIDKPFLATTKARINLESKEIVLRSKGKYLIHLLS